MKTIKKVKKPAATPKSILSRAIPVQELPLVISALLYGRSGTGKTVLACTFPKPLLLIDISEKGTDSVMNEPGIDVIRIESWDEFEQIYWELEKGSKYKSVVVDSQHALQDLAILQAKKERGKEDSDQASKFEFMRASGMMKTWSVAYRDLTTKGINVVFIAHDRVTETTDDNDDDEGSITPEVGPRLMPSVASTVLGSVNIVANTFIREEVTKSKKLGEKPSRKMLYCLRIGPHGYYNTKVRNPKNIAIPDYLEDADYGQLVQVIKGKHPAQQKTAGSGPVRKKLAR